MRELVHDDASLVLGDVGVVVVGLLEVAGDMVVATVVGALWTEEPDG